MLLFDETKKLEKALGEEATRAILNILDASQAEAASKADLEHGLRELELRLTAEVTKITAESKADILKWVAGLLLAQAAVIAALVRLL